MHEWKIWSSYLSDRNELTIHYIACILYAVNIHFNMVIVICVFSLKIANQFLSMQYVQEF